MARDATEASSWVLRPETDAHALASTSTPDRSTSRVSESVITVLSGITSDVESCLDSSARTPRRRLGASLRTPASLLPLSQPSVCRMDANSCLRKFLQPFRSDSSSFRKLPTAVIRKPCPDPSIRSPPHQILVPSRAARPKYSTSNLRGRDPPRPEWLRADILL
jgi:hypothetical protein